MSRRSEINVNTSKRKIILKIPENKLCYFQENREKMWKKNTHNHQKIKYLIRKKKRNVPNFDLFIFSRWYHSSSTFGNIWLACRELCNARIYTSNAGVGIPIAERERLYTVELSTQFHPAASLWCCWPRLERNQYSYSRLSRHTPCCPKPSLIYNYTYTLSVAYRLFIYDLNVLYQASSLPLCWWKWSLIFPILWLYSEGVFFVRYRVTYIFLDSP